ncbi:hypothetical protein D3C84_667510 [compost metagenome]
MHQARFRGGLDTLKRRGPVPFVPRLPTVKGLFLLPGQLGDFADAEALPIQVLGMAAGIGGQIDDGIHGADAAGRTREPLLPRAVVPPATTRAHCCAPPRCRPCPQRNGNRRHRIEDSLHEHPRQEIPFQVVPCRRGRRHH